MHACMQHEKSITARNDIAQMVKVALGLNSDAESSVVSSKGGTSSGSDGEEEPRDLVGGLSPQPVYLCTLLQVNPVSVYPPSVQSCHSFLTTVAFTGLDISCSNTQSRSLL